LIRRLGDDVSQNLLALDWETVIHGIFADGWDFLVVVQVVVQPVEEVVTLSLNETVQVWSVDITTVNGWDVTDLLVLLVNLWGVVVWGLDFSDILVDEQVFVDLVQNELVVDSLGGWVVLTSEGGEFITARDHILGLLSVNVWEDILVPDDEVIIRLTSDNVTSINILTVWDLVWGVVLGGEELDEGVDVLVEVDGVQEVLLEGGELPEALEVDGSDVPLEDWVLDVLTEKWDGQVLTEELSVVDLFEGEDTVNIIDSTEELLLLDWDNAIDNISNKGLLNGVTLTQLLLQQKFIDNWLGQQGPFLGQTKGVKVHAASGNGGDKCDEDKGFHDD